MKKLMKKVKKNSLGLRWGSGGVVADAIRESARNKNLAKLANKK